MTSGAAVCPDLVGIITERSVLYYSRLLMGIVRTLPDPAVCSAHVKQ